jgi:plastocyanin
MEPGFSYSRRDPKSKFLSFITRRYKMRSLGIALTVLVVFWTMGVSDVAAERIRILDRCDPATFNAAGPVLCNPNFDGGVSLEDFQELLTPAGFGHPAWRFNAPYVAIDPDERVRVTNRGGEDHTFTEVPELEEGKNPFGGGRVDALNAPFGLTPLPQCGAAVAPMIHPGDSIQIKKLREGTHYFQCCIHPWMHAIIQVGSEKETELRPHR